MILYFLHFLYLHIFFIFIPRILVYGTGKHRAKPGAFRCRFRAASSSEASDDFENFHETLENRRPFGE